MILFYKFYQYIKYFFKQLRRYRCIFFYAHSLTVLDSYPKTLKVKCKNCDVIFAMFNDPVNIHNGLLFEWDKDFEYILQKYKKINIDNR